MSIFSLEAEARIAQLDMKDRDCEPMVGDGLIEGDAARILTQRLVEEIGRKVRLVGDQTRVETLTQDGFLYFRIVREKAAGKQKIADNLFLAALSRDRRVPISGRLGWVTLSSDTGKIDSETVVRCQEQFEALGGVGVVTKRLKESWHTLKPDDYCKALDAYKLAVQNTYHLARFSTNFTV